MAASELDAAQLELADSLPIDTIPTKLSCTSCGKLAVNAVRLPCCDQHICEPCSQIIAEECPICSHSPVSAADCKPHKSLRMTVKAHIKNEEKKRSKEADTTASEARDVTKANAGAEPSPIEDTPHESNGHVEVDSLPISGGDAKHQDRAPAVVEDTHDQTRGPLDEEELDYGEDEYDEDDDVVITTERPERDLPASTDRAGEEEHQDQNEQGVEQEQADNQQGVDFDQSQNFNSMDFGNMNNFNPMMAMQGGMGMPNFGMGMPNMMSMAGMNMDPSMMFGGFGGMGGMNDMSMMGMGNGMGMNGMGNFGGMSGMDMGGGPGFFPHNRGGYNQQNFGSHMNQNFHHSRGYGRPYNNRGYNRSGRGFYGRGRGGWQNYGQHHAQNQNYNSMNQQYQQQNQFRGNGETVEGSAQQDAPHGSPSYEPVNGPTDTATDGDQEDSAHAKGADETNRTEDDATNDAEDAQLTTRPKSQTEADRRASHDDTFEDIFDDSQSVIGNDEGGSVNSGTRAPEESMDPDRAAYANAPQSQANYDQSFQQGQGYGLRGRGGFRGGRGGFRGGGYMHGQGPFYNEVESAPTAAAPPINAPTGPKAMREGLPNTGWYSRPQQAPHDALQPSQPEKQKKLDCEARSRTPSRSRSRSQPESRQHGHKERRKSDVRDESEESYERRKERERRKRREREGRYDERDEAVNDDGHHRKTRSRSESKDEGRSKRRHRERESERQSSRSHRDRSREGRRHRHRSRSPKEESGANGEGYESSRRKHRSDRKRDDEYYESDKAKEGRRRRSRRDDDYEPTSKDHSNESSRHARSSREERHRERDREKRPSVIEEPEEEFEFKIKGKSATMKQSGEAMGPPASFGRERSERRPSTQNSNPPTPTSGVDPYAADRENARKKREAEQHKRMEGRRQSSQGLGKHSRDDDEVDAPTGPRGDTAWTSKRVRKDVRKHSAKYEGEVGDGYEDRDNQRWR